MTHSHTQWQKGPRRQLSWTELSFNYAQLAGGLQVRSSAHVRQVTCKLEFHCPRLMWLQLLACNCIRPTGCLHGCSISLSSNSVMLAGHMGVVLSACMSSPQQTRIVPSPWRLQAKLCRSIRHANCLH